jgi:hypothetical protein
VIYATGSARLSRLTLHARRAIRPAHYTLILRRPYGHRWTTTRRTITLA